MQLRLVCAGIIVACGAGIGLRLAKKSAGRARLLRELIDALKLLSVALGAVIYYIVIQFVLTAGLNTNDLKLITALVVAIFLAIPYWKGKYFRAAVKTKKEDR